MSKMQLPKMEQNMGLMDRIVRSAIGGALVMNWANRESEGKAGPWSRLSGAIGAAFLTYGVTGWDPLLTVAHLNTLPGSERNIARRAQDALPETQDLVWLSQQVTGNGQRVLDKGLEQGRQILKGMSAR